MGASIRVITHYFADKDSLLLGAYRILASQGQAPVLEIMSRDPADLAGALKALCGGDDATLKRWRVYVAFWDKAVRSPQFASEQRLWAERTLTTIGQIVTARAGSEADVRQLAMELISLVYGISVQRTLDPDSWTQAAIASAIDRKVREVDQLG